MRSGLRWSLVSVLLVALLSGCSSPSHEPVQPVQVPEPRATVPPVASEPPVATAPARSLPPAVAPTATKEPKVIGHSTIDLPGHPAAPVTFVQDPQSYVVGVTVDVGGRSVLLRAPSPQAGGLVGPDGGEKLWAEDLDGDGTPEILLYGLAGAHSWGIWVYRYVPATESFTRLDDVMGSSGVEVVQAANGRKAVRAGDRDYFRSGGRTLHLYAFAKGSFNEVPCPLSTCTPQALPGGAPQSEQLVNGPYTALLGRPLPEIEKLLGAPPAKRIDEWGDYWSYPSRGLALDGAEGALVKLTQIKGKVTATVTLGDRLSAEESKSYVESSAQPGISWKRIYDGGAVIDLTAKDSRLVKAELTPEAKRN